jgi:hypothetical protein
MATTLVAIKSEPKYTRENQVELTREAGAESFKQENQSGRKTTNWRHTHQTVVKTKSREQRQ